MTNYEKVKEFHRLFGLRIGDNPVFPDDEERALRIRLLKEEYEEYLDGEEKNDLAEVADGLTDMLYIIYGTMVSYGIPADDIFSAIHQNNLTKLGPDGKPIIREDGKVLKPEGYKKFDAAKFLKKVGK